jgi:hypothetical protein
MVEGHHGTVSNDSNVEKGELATKEKKTHAGTLQPALQVRVGSQVEISNPPPPCWQPMRQTHGFAQSVINPSDNNILSIKLSLKGLIMLFKPPNSSTTLSPTLSHLK